MVACSAYPFVHTRCRYGYPILLSPPARIMASGSKTPIAFMENVRRELMRGERGATPHQSLE